MRFSGIASAVAGASVIFPTIWSAPSSGYQRLRDEIGLYDAMLMFYHGIIAFDHVQHRLWIVRNVHTDGEGSLRAKYSAAVREIRKTRQLLEQASPAEQAKKQKKKRRAPLRVTSNFRRTKFDAVRKAKNTSARAIFFRWDQPAFPLERTPSLRMFIASPRAQPVSYLSLWQMNDIAAVGSSPRCSSKCKAAIFTGRLQEPRRRGKRRSEDQRPNARCRQERARRVICSSIWDATILGVRVRYQKL